MKFDIIASLLFYQFSFCLMFRLNQENKQLRTSSCGVSKIHIPLGSTLPIMTYNAREKEKEYNLIYVPQENKEKYLQSQENKNKTIIKNDTTNNSTWYIEEDEEPKNDAIAMCFRLNEEIMNRKEYEENGKYAKYRIVESNEKEIPVQMTSYINIEEEINEEDNESNLEDIDDLDSLIDHNSNQNKNEYKDDFYFEN